MLNDTNLLDLQAFVGFVVEQYCSETVHITAE